MPVLEVEFQHQCVYCRLPDGLGAEFAVEHYRPRQKFPQLITEYTNLFYACKACNSQKSDYWPTAAEFDAGAFIPNPCDYVMADLLWYRGVEVSEKDKAGRFTIRLLQLNNTSKVSFREFVVRMISHTVSEYRELRATLRQLESMEREEDDPSRLKELQFAADDLKRDLAKMKEDLVRLTGNSNVRVPK